MVTISDPTDQIEVDLTADLLKVCRAGMAADILSIYAGCPSVEDIADNAISGKVKVMLEIITDQESHGNADYFGPIAQRAFRNALIAAMKEIREKEL